jgi:short-subunit dehydrogenase
MNQKDVLTMNDLKKRFGPAALITGASDGIGRALAEALAAQGFDLILVARRESVLHSLSQELMGKHAIKVEVIAADLSDPRATAMVLQRTRDMPVGLLVAAAGFGSIGPFVALDVAEEANMVDLNCRAVVELTHGLAQRLIDRGGGGIILFGSLFGFQGVPGSATYAATKGFVQSFAEALAIELRPQGISVLSVAPGPVGTGFAARARMHMSKTDSPQAVARASLAALPGGGTHRPGVLSKLLGWSLAILPRWARVRLLGLIAGGMRAREPATKA